MRRGPWGLGILLVGCGWLAGVQRPAQACAYPVRDAAFTQWPRGYATLFLLYANKDEKKTVAWRTLMEQAGKTYLMEANLGFHEVDTRAEGFDPKEYGLKDIPKDLPAVIAQVQEPSIELLRLSGEPNEAALRALIDSPLRKSLRDLLVAKLGVALFLPGKEEAKNTAVRKLLKETAEQFKKQTQLEISVLELNRADPDKKEAGLISQILLKETPEPVVAVIFGRGKVVHDKLEGAAITEDNLWGLFSVPGGPCLCTVAPSMIGYDLVMSWPEELNQKIVLVGKGEEGEGEPGQKPPTAGAEMDPLANGAKPAPTALPAAAGATPPAAAAPPAAPATVAQQLQMEPAPALKDSSSMLLFGVLGAALLVLLVAGAVLVFKKGSDAA